MPISLFLRGLALLLLVGGTAHAELITTRPHGTFSSRPLTLDIGGGAASYSFSSAAASERSIAPVGISTGGTARVASYGAPFYDPPRPASYIGPGIIADDTLAMYVAYPATVAIPFSNARIFLGLQFELRDGVHFGYAELFDMTLVTFAYETIAGQKVIVGADPSDPPAVPEPSSIALLASALSIVAFRSLRQTRRRRASL
ncbi:hypothetical protein [Roseiterribacter gracilis]|uniref:PEP-CTERM protein-sorting domain-containing protein n=1 Tax=Roseiterribacter gracilis TaxID=2812848 RepID=A0A8S8XAR1_9PROT|nr:hypothetical protein TMPK1_20810 [Rhodospirillales bacterium TMPK1]